MPYSRQNIKNWQSRPLKEQIRPFSSGGCSLSPEGSAKYPKLWLDCCLKHDLAYWKGGIKVKRKAADLALKVCIESKGTRFSHYLYYIGTRLGGGPQWETPFKWGYGWNYDRGYLPLTKDEIEYINKFGPKKEENLNKYLILKD